MSSIEIYGLLLLFSVISPGFYVSEKILHILSAVNKTCICKKIPEFTSGARSPRHFSRNHFVKEFFTLLKYKAIAMFFIKSIVLKILFIVLTRRVHYLTLLQININKNSRKTTTTTTNLTTFTSQNKCL